MVLQAIANAILALLRLIYGFIAAILHFLWTLIPRIVYRESELPQEFQLQFKDSFGIKLPSEPTSLSAARKKALKMGRPLIAYFHGRSEQGDGFCQTVLSQPTLLELIESRFILWCGDIEHPAILKCKLGFKFMFRHAQVTNWVFPGFVSVEG